MCVCDWELCAAYITRILRVRRSDVIMYSGCVRGCDVTGEGQLYLCARRLPAGRRVAAHQ